MSPLSIALLFFAVPCPAPHAVSALGNASSSAELRAIRGVWGARRQVEPVVRAEDPAEERGEELIHVYERLRELHPDLFFGTPEAEFDAALDHGR